MRARAWAPGAALVGDAADFFDPFTGEGMFEALRGGEMLGPYLCEALASTSPRVTDEALAAYDRARRHQFAATWRVQKIVALAVAFPPMLNHTVRAANETPRHRRSGRERRERIPPAGRTGAAGVFFVSCFFPFGPAA